MINEYPPVGFRAVHTLRRHPNAFTIENRKRKLQPSPNKRRTFGSTKEKLNPWKRDLELIEGKCGQAVTTYFKFLRRLIILNGLLSCIVSTGIIIPYLLMKYTKRLQPPDEPHCAYPPEVDDASWLNYVLYIFNGQILLEKTFIFYGFYEAAVTETSHYNLPLLFLGTNILIFAFSLIYISIQAGKGMEAKIVGKSGELFKYSKLIFGWDMNISDRDTAVVKKRLLATQIRNELKEDKLIGERDSWSFLEKCWIIFIRLITTIGNLLILLGSIVAVVLASTEGKKLQSSNKFLKLFYSYLVSMTIGGTSMIAPIFFKVFTSFQKLRAETGINQVIGWRVALRFLSISAVFITIFFEVAHCHSVTVEIESIADDVQKVKSFLNPNETTLCNCDNPLYTCWPTVLGQECYRLTLGWFLGQLGTVFFLAGGSRLIKNSFGYTVPFVSTFDITDNVMKIVSWQTITWLGVFYCPILPVIVFVVQVLVFYLNRFAVVQIHQYDDDNHYKSSNGAVYFTVLMVVGFYLGTFMTIAALILFVPSSSCGPFQEYSSFQEPFMDFLDSHDKINHIWSTITFKPVLYTSVLIIASVCYFLNVKSCGLNERIRVLEQQLTKEGEDAQFLILKRKHQSSQQNSNNSARQPRRPPIIERADQMRESGLSRAHGRGVQKANHPRRSEPTDRESATVNLVNRSSALLTRESVISWT